ncbi:uncharacterized protein HaLaN_25694 [Haematococcus lacustris]|uniref:Ketoreductase domain-containing protein n=1 Tax=Haematococcus lacustris TaxID=44745 RepID=A0A6A0A473_HAELA|nr:uncharacterized protein HaLaN_25694 [Haematococcus lacustris]
MPFRIPLAGKHVFITGGSTGIGLALAREFVSKSCNVTIVARNPSKLEAAASELREYAKACQQEAAPVSSVQFYTADVTVPEQVNAAVASAEAAGPGPIDILVCNAGAAAPGFFHDTHLSVFESSMRLNYLGVVASVKACYSRMLTRNTGHLCLISSVMGTMGFVGYSSYAPTKYAVKGLADCLRNEPAETRDISAMSTVFKSQQVAQSIVRGIQAGLYTLPSPDMGLALHCRMMQGLVPRGLLAIVVETLLGLVMPAVQAVHGIIFDRISRKHSKARFAGFKRSKRTKAEPAADPNKGKGKAAKAKPAPQPGRWLDRDCNAALNMKRIGESKWCPLELCYWPDQGALPANGKEYPGLGYKWLRDKSPKAQEQQQPAVAQ